MGTPPQTVSDLVEAAGVTRTAIMGQLNELVAAGLVEREMKHCAVRGRPRHLYRATSAGLQLFANHWAVIPAIWRAIAHVVGDEALEEVLKSVAHELAKHYSRRIDAEDPLERMRQLIELFRESGELIDMDEESGQPLVRKRSCAFVGLHDHDRKVCCVGQEMMSEVVGRPVRRTACRYEGSPCCTFQIFQDEQVVEDEQAGD